MPPNNRQNWRPPDSLGYSSLRPVRLTGQGIAIACIAGFLIVGAVVLGVFLTGKVRRESQAQRLLGEQGVIADAVITRLWRSGDKSNEPHVSYRFGHDGNIYTGSVRAPLRQWREMKVGEKLAVRFVPSRPSISHPVDWPSRGLPAWFPYVLSAFVAGIGSLLGLQVVRQMRLLAEGRPAPGRITGIRKAKTPIVLYEFELLNGTTIKGHSGVSKTPAEGTLLCVLYDPENPRRNALYPLQMVRLG